MSETLFLITSDTLERHLPHGPPRSVLLDLSHLSTSPGGFSLENSGLTRQRERLVYAAVESLVLVQEVNGGDKPAL